MTKDSTSSGTVPSERMLVVVAQPGAGLRAQASSVTSAADIDTGDLNRLLAGAGARIRTLFGEPEERLMARAALAPSGAAAADEPQLHLFYRVEAPDCGARRSGPQAGHDAGDRRRLREARAGAGRARPRAGTRGCGRRRPRHQRDDAGRRRRAPRYSELRGAPDLSRPCPRRHRRRVRLDGARRPRRRRAGHRRRGRLAVHPRGSDREPGRVVVGAQTRTSSGATTAPRSPG